MIHKISPHPSFPKRGIREELISRLQQKCLKKHKLGDRIAGVTIINNYTLAFGKLSLRITQVNNFEDI
jgi:hypothetical protein